MNMLEQETKDSGEETNRETQALSGAFLMDVDSENDKRFSVYDFIFLWTFFVDEAWNSILPGRFNLDALSNATHVFMNSIYERFCTRGVGESVRTLCSRTRVFKSWLYDSAKGWDFTWSPCFLFLHLHFSSIRWNGGMFVFSLWCLPAPLPASSRLG